MAIALLAVCGCASPPRSDTDAEIRNRAIALLKATKPDGVTDNTEITPAQFAMTGYRLVDENCANYFEALTRAKNSVQMTKADISAIGAAAAVIASLAQTAQKDIGIGAALFGLTTVILDNVQQFGLLTPYPEETSRLVSKAMDKYRTSSPPDSSKDAFEAADFVAGYAKLCTYTEISSLAQQAISAADVEDEAAEPAVSIFSNDERAIYIKTMEGVLGTTLTDQDVIVLAYMSELPSDSEIEKALSGLKPNASQAVFDSGSKKTKPAFATIKDILSTLLSNNRKIRAAVDAVKKESRAKAAFAMPSELTPRGLPPTNRRPRIVVRSSN